jgi:UTP:GlnB (protein PII) uridylyltransferase
MTDRTEDAKGEEARAKTISERARELLTRKRAMTYEAIAAKLREEYGSRTQKASVQWYATQLRKEGVEPNIKRPG